MVSREVQQAGYIKKLAAGVVVTGGAAAQPGTAELASDVFGTGARIGVPGEFLGGLGADPVYRLLGTDGLSQKEWPAPVKLVDSRIGYYLRVGRHDVTREDWQAMLAFADVVTQRLLKALLAGKSNPYSDDELAGIATNCTVKEDAARKVEREMSKRLAAVAMSQRIGETFDAIVTGVTPHGTFVRVLKPHIEGLLAQDHHALDVGDKVRVRLTRTDVQRGYIDFGCA